jgi:N-dimethylarginine dimethylaminohydrolase
MSDYGCRSMTDPLRRVLVRRPSVGACTLWEEYGWRAAPDPTALLLEHERFCAVLEEAGAEIVLAEPLDDDPDAIYTFDPGFVAESGAVLMRPGKEGRRQEPSRAARDLEAAGVPIAGTVPEPAVAEGGDFIRLDERTLLAGRGYRTSAAGIDAVSQLLPDVGLHVFDLPHWRGESEVMHLLSLLSPLDADLVVAYPPLLPVALAQLLEARGIEIVAVPDDEFPSMGTNVLALAPRVALALDGSPVTRARLTAAGVEVLVYEGKELSLKGDGGPTCLTMPLLRG